MACSSFFGDFPVSKVRQCNIEEQPESVHVEIAESDRDEGIEPEENERQNTQGSFVT